MTKTDSGRVKILCSVSMWKRWYYVLVEASNGKQYLSR